MNILIYGSNGWIGNQVVEYLNSQNIKYTKGNERVDNTESLENEISLVNPTHIVSFIGRTHGKIGDKIIPTIDYLEEDGKLVENIRDNLFSPLILAIICQRLDIHFTYLGTGCIFDYDDEHNNENNSGFKEEDNYLYIHLGGNRFTRLNYQSTKPQEPYLVEANARVSSYNRDLKSFTIKFAGYMPLQFSFANVENCQISSKSQLTITKNLDKTITYNSKATHDEIHFNCR